MSKMVRDAMTSQPVTIEHLAFVKSAAELVARQDVGSLPVVDERGSLVGILDRRRVRLTSGSNRP
jgi:CBS domain-containing protein